MPSKRPTTNELIAEFLPTAEAEACRMVKKHAEFAYLLDDIKGEAALRLVQILQPDSVNWDENSENSENLKIIAGFVRIAIMRRCIDIFRKEGLRAEKVRSRTDIASLALSYGTHESTLLRQYLEGVDLDEIKEALEWDKNTTREVLDQVLAIAAEANTPPAAGTLSGSGTT